MRWSIYDFLSARWGKCNGLVHSSIWRVKKSDIGVCTDSASQNSYFLRPDFKQDNSYVFQLSWREKYNGGVHYVFWQSGNQLSRFGKLAKPIFYRKCWDGPLLIFACDFLVPSSTPCSYFGCVGLVDSYGLLVDPLCSLCVGLVDSYGLLVPCLYKVSSKAHIHASMGPTSRILYTSSNSTPLLYLVILQVGFESLYLYNKRNKLQY
jgi:hypothetical protein